MRVVQWDDPLENSTLLYNQLEALKPAEQQEALQLAKKRYNELQA